jgi:hypothetical protein
MRGPFARVARSETAHNQSIPHHIASLMAAHPKRGVSIVRNLTLDMNWSQSQASYVHALGLCVHLLTARRSWGSVNFAVLGLSTTDPASSLLIPKQNARRSMNKRKADYLYERSF